MPPALRQPAGFRRRRTGEWRPVAAAVLFCTGLMILPPLATLDLAVGLACKALDRGACLALFMRSSE